MDAIEFNKLDVLKQIEYINYELAKNLTLREVIERDLNLTRSTIRRRFKNCGYTHDKEKNKYIYTGSNKDITNSNITKSNTTKKQITKEDNKTSNKNITKSNITYVESSNINSIDNNIVNKPIDTEDTKASNKNITKSNTTYVKDSSANSIDNNNITDSNITKDITFTKEEIIALKKLVAQNKKKEKIIDVRFTGNLTVKTVKIYNTVLEEYNKFLKKHKELKQQDIISLAIKEFLDKYK